MDYKKLYEKTHGLCTGLKFTRSYESAVAHSKCVDELKKSFTNNDLNSIPSLGEFIKETEKAIFPVHMTPSEGIVISGLYADLKGLF